MRKVATMVKRLKKSPEDGELQTPPGGEVVIPAGDGWDAQQQATVTAYAQSRGMQPREVLQALVNSMENGRQRVRMKLDPALDEGGETRERRNQMPDVSHAIETKGEMCPRRPGGRKSKKKRPATWGQPAKRIRL